VTFENATFVRGGKFIGFSRVLVAAGALLALASVPAFGQPSVVSTVPSSGVGASQTFTLTVADGAGASAIAAVYFQVNTAISVANTCMVSYSHAANGLYLLNDAGTSYQGPITPGTSGSLSNSQCTLNAASASVFPSGNSLILNLPLSFTSAFAGAKNTFGIAQDTASQWSLWNTTGSWTVLGGPPTVVSALPASGSGSSQTFAVTVADAAGPSVIAAVYFLVNTVVAVTNACLVSYNHAGNGLYLLNDAGTSYQGPITPGTSGSVSNSQCTLNAAGASVSTSGSNLILNLPLSFAVAFAGAKSTFALAGDTANQFSSWATTGSWTVPGSGPPTVLSTLPASGSGTSQTFALTVNDGSGPSNISAAYFIVNTAISAANSCFVAYNRGANALYLMNDAGTSYQGPITPGTSGSVSNSQCALSALIASVSTSGNNLTLNLPLTLTFAFHGAKNTFGLAQDKAGQYSPWTTTGTWSVPAAPPPVPEPIPPPFTPNTVTGGFNSLQGTVRVKASPDECYLGLGQNVKWDFINQSNPSQPCGPGKIPKANDGYVWGSALINGIAYFGTQANAQCIGEGAISKSLTGPTPYATDTWTCEFARSPYAQPNGPLPAQIGDQRPPRMYAYNLATHAVQDITPKLGGSPGAYCSAAGANPLCIDSLWLTMRGVRTATSYTEPTTGRTYLIVSGPALVMGSNALDFFAYDVVAQKWVAKYQYVGYNDMRHWITVGGVLYAPVGKPGSAGGALVQYTGNFAVLPTPPVPVPGNNFNQIPICGTTSPTIPPAPPGAFQCFAFQNVGNFDGVGTDAVVHEGRIFAATWPPPGSGSLWMSPPIQPGGFGQPNPNPPLWTKVWNINTNYDPDPLVSASIGTGALADFNGVLYWGTMVYGVSGTLQWFQKYGIPTDQQDLNLVVVNTFRTGTIFSGTNFATGSPTINLLYGQPTFFVYNPTTQKWVLTPNNMNGARPLYGSSGFGNPYNNYIWTMTQFNNKLYVGTMDWGYEAADAFFFVQQGQGQPLPDISKLIPPQQYGADLYTFADTNSAAVAESINGLGNYLNYGIRAMLPNGSASLFLGTANPHNIATTSTTTPHGGWELIEATPGTQVKGR
jgi:hypothetical protein